MITKDNIKYTIESAREYSSRGKIEDWILGFLNGEGKNKKLAEIMIGNGSFVGPIEVSLAGMVRCAGPEKEMKFHESWSRFSERVGDLVQAMEQGFEVPPLIVWDVNGVYSIADGNHRYEALKKKGFVSYWTIIWKRD